MTDVSQDRLIISIYKIAQWYSTQHSKPTACSKTHPARWQDLHGLKQLIRKVLCFRRYSRAACICDRKARVHCIPTLVLFINTLELYIVAFGGWILEIKQAPIHTHTVSFCDTEPLPLLNLTTFLHIRTRQSEASCSHWQNRSNLQPFCSVMMTGLRVLLWLRCLANGTTDVPWLLDYSSR